MADVDLTPTAEMARNAARGLELRREHGRGGTEVGVARARDISNGKTLSPETVRRMHAFFSRHAKNKAGGEDDAGYIAWMLWGGDEGRDWASRKVDALDRKERNAMSDTRKAIMERLGMAATNDRSGAKAKMGMEAKYPQAFLDAMQLMQQFEDLEPTSALKQAASDQGIPEGAEMRKFVEWANKRIRASRPGAKAKMAKWTVVMPSIPDAGTRHFDSWEQAKNYVDTKMGGFTALVSVDGKRYALKHALGQWEKFSRPGAKAKMGRNDAQIEFLLQSAQSAMKVNDARAAGKFLRAANDLVEENTSMALRKRLGEMLSGKMSRPGAKAKMDRYVMTSEGSFHTYLGRDTRVPIEGGSGWIMVDPAQYVTPKRVRVKGVKGEVEVQAVVQGDRIVGVTAKALRASRPGAKAKMATARDVKEAKAAGLRVGDIVRYKDIVDPDDRKWRARIVELRGPRLLVSNDVMPEFRDWALPPSTSVMVDEVVKASRPGAKVRAALADACGEGYEAVGTKPQDGKTVPNCVPKMKAGRAEDLYRKLSGGTITNANVREWDRLVTEALRMPDFTPPGGDMSLHEIAEELGGEIMALKSRAAKAQAAKPAEDDLEREDVKAGLKLMSASDPAVSDKIRTLIKEGKPQDQAVAIALDMKRRGEL